MVRGRSIFRQLVKYVILTIVCVVLTAFFFEMYLRYKGFLKAQPAPYPCITGDPVLNHVFEKDCEAVGSAAGLKVDKDVTYKINSFGFRGKEPGARGRRLLVIGDSYTEGFGLEENETFPFRLEGELKKLGARDVEVLNGGTMGYSPALYTIYFDRYFSNLRPNFVLLNLDLSDFADDARYLQIAEYDTAGNPISFPGRNTFPSFLMVYVYRNHSALLRFIHQEWQHWHLIKLRRENEPKMDRLVGSSPVYVSEADLDHLGIKNCVKPIEMTIKKVMELKQKANSVGAGFGIHMFPSGYNVKKYEHLPQSISFVQAWDQRTRKDFSWACYASPKFAEAIKAVAKRQNIPFFDSFPKVMSHPQKESLYFSRDAHWNSKGVEFVTESIAPSVLRAINAGKPAR